MYFSEFWRQEAKIMVLAWLDKGPHFWFIANTFSPCLHMIEGTRNLCGISFTRSLNAVHEGPTLMGLINSQRPSYRTHHLWRWRSQQKNFRQDRTQILRPWYWSTWRTWGKSRELVSSCASGLALIQRQLSALDIWTLEDPRGVHECSDPRPCWISWTELPVVPLPLCFARFCMCHLTFYW